MRTTVSRRLGCVLAGVVALGAAPGAARAQAEAAPAEAPQPEPKPRPKPKPVVEEIVVTAERREQSVQDIGVAIEALSTEELKRRGVGDIYDLAAAVPSLQVTGGLPQPTLRGVSSDVISPGVDAPFAAHINGQYVPQLAVALLPFLDLKRVEVLYGPQGTLFGHATTGGTLNFVTALPEPELGFEIEGDYASYDRASVVTVANLPLVEEKVLARLAYRRDWPSRVMDVDGGHNDALSNQVLSSGHSTRLSLSFLPQDDVRIDLIGGWTYDDSTGGAATRLEPYPAFPAGRSVLFNGFSATPNFTGATPVGGDANEVHLNRRQSQDFTVGMGQALVSIDMGWASLKSNTSFYSFDYFVDIDADGSDLEIERLTLSSFDVQWGQEFLLQSSTGNRVDWLVGANYYNHRTPDADVPIWDRQVDADAANFIIVRPDLSIVSFFAPRDGSPVLRAHAETKTEVWGLFAHTWLNFTDSFRFVGGIRYSDTERRFDDQSTFDVYLVPPVPIPGVAVLLALEGTRDQEDEWDFITWRAGFEFEPVDDSLLYVSFGRGEQAGGFNFLSLNPLLDPNDPVPIEPFESERIYALEAGAKNQFLDDRLQLNLAAYYYDYENKFITRTVATGIVETVNAPEAVVYGAELSGIWLPTDELRLNGSIGLVHSEYTEDFFAVNSTLTAACPLNAPCNPSAPNVSLTAPLPEENLEGNRLNRSPPITVTVGAEYALDFGDWRLTPRVDHSWRDKSYFSQFNDDEVSMGSYHQTNARVRLEPSDGRYWLELYATNLQNDDEIRTQAQGVTANPTWWLAEPRMLGFRVGYKY